MKKTQYHGNLLASIRKYKLNSIFLRNFVIVFVAILLILAINSWGFISNQLNIIEEEVLSNNQLASKRSADIIDAVIGEAYDMAYAISTSKTTLSCILTHTNQLYYSEWVKNLSDYLRLLSLSFDYLDSLSVYSELNQNILTKSGTRSLSSDDECWYKYYQESITSRIITISQRKNNRYPYLITVICPIVNSKMEKLGAVVLDLNIEGIGKMVADTVDQNHTLYLVDSTRRLFYVSNLEDIRDNDYLDEALFLIDSPSEAQSTIRNIRGENIVYTYTHSCFNDFIYIYTSAYETYQTQYNHIRFTELLVIFTGLSGIIIVFLVSLQLSKPFSDIIGEWDDSVDMQTASTFVPRPDKNEIDRVTNIIRTARSENALIKEEMEERMRRLKYEQIRALQSQIDPHFLFNSLDTIRWKSIDQTGGKDSSVSNMISSLANLLRVSLDTSHYLVPLSDEIRHVKIYMDIVMERYKNRVNAQFLIPDELLSKNILKLTIQPIVENAIRHGLRPKRYEGTVTISITSDETLLTVTVSDNGIGMTPQQVEQVNGFLLNPSTDTGEHIGLRNVNQRIKLVYGEEYGIQFTTGENGTSVSFSVPIINDSCNPDKSD